MESRQPSLTQVEAAAQIVRQFHATGERSRKKRPDTVKAKYGSRRTDTARDRSRAERERQARMVARAYANDQLKGLLKECQRHRFPLTVTHLVLLARIKNKKRRSRLEQEMIRGQLGRRALEQLIRLGRKRQGHGHGRKQIRSRRDAAYSILQFCITFESLLAGLRRGDRRDATWLDQLAPLIQERLGAVEAAVAAIRDGLQPKRTKP